MGSAPGADAADWNICSHNSTTDSAGTLYDSGGAFGNYSDNENCSFLISPSGSPSQITLSFSGFSVESGYDELRIYDGTDEFGTLLGTFSGNSLPGDVIATSGSMYVVFESDYIYNYSGFAATWSTSAAGPSTSWNICSDSSSSDAAGYLYDSGGAGGNYGNNESCTFTITPSGGPAATDLSWSYDILSGDILQIYQGTDDTGPLVTTGTSMGGGSISMGGVVNFFIQFTSNSSGTSSGFTIEWNDPGSFNTTVSGTVFEDVHYGGGPGRSLADASGVVRSNVTVELYDNSGNYLANTTTAVDGTYSFSSLSAGLYTVRVVNATVTSSRSGANGTEVAVQTFRADGDGEAAGTGTAKVGGEQPQSVDAAANNSSATLAALQASSGQYTQSIVTVDASAGSVADVDFGFNFDTIVNTNDSGQGSLRQFIANANLLANTGLDQDDWGAAKNAGVEHSIFMIPLTDSGYGADPTGGGGNAFVIQSGAVLPIITDADTAIDGRTQTAFSGDTNSAVANTSTGPEVVVDYGVAIKDHHFRFLSVRGYLYQIGVYRGGDEVADKGAIRFENVVTTGSVIQGITVFQSATHGLQILSSNGITISNSISRANGTASAGADGLTMSNGSAITMTGNSFVGNAGWGIELWDGTCVNNIISTNYIAGNGAGQVNGGIWLNVGSQNTITQNTITANTGDGILISNGAADNTISENAIYANSDLGIDLSADNYPMGDGVSLNDTGDSDSGGNALLNFPVITSATETGGTVSIDFDLDVPAGDYRIEFFTNPSGAHLIGYGEGESFAGAVSITHPGGGVQRFSHSFSGAAGDIITATATVDSGGSYGSTSEFSAAYTATDPPPDIILTKSAAIISDPFNGTAHPKMIPGAVLTYTVTVTNQGLGATDADTVIITNPIGSEAVLFTGDLSGGGSAVIFQDGTPSSGLSLSNSQVTFSNNNGSSFDYTPSGGTDFDPAVTHIRMAPSGAFNASDGANHPSFTLQYRVRIN